MPEAVDAYRYIRYLWARRPWIALSVVTAGVLAIIVTLLMTREFTATVRILIEPPAGTDLRAAMAVSPIYLESLRTYEEFAASDRVFADAVERFHLRSFYPGVPVESIKRRVLKVQILRNTRILEVSATLPDPRKAEALAQHLAASTVALNRATVSAGDRDLMSASETQERDLRDELDRIEAEWARVSAREPVGGVRAAIESDESLHRDLEQQRLSAERMAAAHPASLIGNSRANLTEIQRQLNELNRRTAARERLLAERQARLDKLDADRSAARAALAGVETQLREARGDAGYRGERLRVIDPGIVPEKPSAPNLPLNLAAALMLGFLLPVGYFTIEMQFRRAGGVERRTFRSYAAALDE